ncbi:hypothetical protein GQ53DRAFT_758995 [Thozetella sp. PMI_491]|nr:hypothetical protein GQ53DRAFT_758995 [Thozetella sp. PMI_491]
MASVTLQSAKPRQRAAHTKSRNGCMSCKARRVRCSEDKPTCNNSRGCLTRGTDCLYNTGIPTQTPGRKPNAVPQPQPIKIIVPRILSGAPRDPFDALPVKMTFRSPEAFYHYSLWFRHTLCISASYLALQGVLEWLAQDLHDTNRPVPVPYMSVVAAMVMSDSASGEDEGAKAHLRGFFTLLETRKRTEPAWRFYDSMLKRVVMMAVFLISSVRPNREHPEAESKAGNPAIRDRLCSPMIPSMFTQMVNEFLRMPILMGSPYATRRADGQTLAWLHKMLREANAAGRREKDPWNDPSHLDWCIGGSASGNI